MRRPVGPPFGICAAAWTLLLAAVVAGCDAGSADSSPDGTQAQLRLEPTRVTRVVGELAPARKRQLARRARGLLEAYVTAAFIEARQGAAAFPGFTSGARKLAEHDRALVTADAFDGAPVAPRAGSALLAVLAPRGRPAGVTARLELVLDVGEEGSTRRVKVEGRVLLAPAEDGWRIFGYDLARSGWDRGGEAAG